LKDLTRVVAFDGDDFDDRGSAVGTTRGPHDGGFPNATDANEHDVEGTEKNHDASSAPFVRASFPAPFPSDISGTYKGRWQMITRLGSDGTANGTTTPHLPGMHAFLEKANGDAGVVVVQLRSRWDETRRVQSVVGEAALRDGAYISDDDQHIKVEGVYVETTGMLAMFGESRIPSEFSAAKGADSTLRAAAGGGGDEVTSQKKSEQKRRVNAVSRSPASSSRARSKYREALRIAARDVVDMPFTPNALHADSEASADGFDLDRADETLSRPESVPGSPGISRMQRDERARALDDSEPGTYLSRCSFALKMWVEPGAFKPIDPGYAEGTSPRHQGVLPGVPEARRSERMDSASVAKTRAETWSKKNAPIDRTRFSLPGEGGVGSGTSPGNKGGTYPTLQGSFVSEECGFELRLTATWFKLEEYYKKATSYAVMIIFSAAAQIYLVARQTEHTRNTQSGFTKMSLGSVGFMAVLDSYQCLLHLTAGIVADALFHVFSLTAFLQFSLFSVFEMRVMLHIWKARRPNGEQNWLEIRRDLSNLYSRFYGGFLLGFLGVYWLQKRPWLIALLASSYWVPQIAWTTWSHAKRPLKTEYVLGMSVTRSVLPLYAFGCPSNFVRLKPQYGTCCMLILWTAAQAAVILTQSHYGPRFFSDKMPAFLRDRLPSVYDYHRIVDESALTLAGAGDEERGEAGGVDCVICMNPVQCENEKRNERMVTPCSHFFHKECLERWMDVKMECPTCRGALPPLSI
jgi:hypothetical protein